MQQNFLPKGQILGCENKRGLMQSQLLPLAPCSPLAANLHGTAPTSVSSLTVHWHCLGIPAQDSSHRGPQMAFNHLKTSSNSTRLQETTWAYSCFTEVCLAPMLKSLCCLYGLQHSGGSPRDETQESPLPALLFPVILPEPPLAASSGHSHQNGLSRPSNNNLL